MYYICLKCYKTNTQIYQNLRIYWIWIIFFKTEFLCVSFSALKLSLQIRLALNSEICFLLLPGAGIKGMCHYTQPQMKNSIEIDDNDSANSHRRLRILHIKINFTLTLFETKLCVDIFTLLLWDVFLFTVNAIGL